MTEAKKRANNKYNAKTYTTLGCRVRKDEAEQFKQACENAGTSPNAIFREAMLAFMGKEYTIRKDTVKQDDFKEDTTYEPCEDIP